MNTVDNRGVSVSTAEKIPVDFEELRVKRDEWLNGENALDFVGKRNFFAELIKNKYGNAVYDYLAWHALSDSSLSELEKKEMSDEDFPGGYSVKNFLFVTEPKKWDEIIANLKKE